jgi:hypothetical protein
MIHTGTDATSNPVVRAGYCRDCQEEGRVFDRMNRGHAGRRGLRPPDDVFCIAPLKTMDLQLQQSARGNCPPQRGRRRRRDNILRGRVIDGILVEDQ